MANKTLFSTDLNAKTVTVTRTFDAPVARVWDAWTTSDALDQWWAPKPYRAKTKSMNFKVGGFWLYAMVGPDNSHQWCRVDFKEIKQLKHLVTLSNFCDENGVVNEEMPAMTWLNTFTEEAGKTIVRNEISFETKAELETIISMGFEQGYNMGLENLTEYLGLSA